MSKTAAERVEEIRAGLEIPRDMDKAWLVLQHDTQRDEIAGLREALEWYANEDNYDEDGVLGAYVAIGNVQRWETDWGRIAQEALERKGGEDNAKADTGSGGA